MKVEGVGNVARAQFRSQLGSPELFGKFPSHISIILAFEVSLKKETYHGFVQNSLDEIRGIA